MVQNTKLNQGKKKISLKDKLKIVALSTLAAGTITGAIGLGGYFNKADKQEQNMHDQYYKNEYKSSESQIKGIVLGEINPEENPKGDYIIKLKTDNNKTLNVSIIDTDNVKKDYLNNLIDKGSRISFPKGNIKQIIEINEPGRYDLFQNSFYGPDGPCKLNEPPTDPLNEHYCAERYPDESYFHPDTKVGTKRADRISILENS